MCSTFSGSGKSFTMFGDGHQGGLLRRSISFILNTKQLTVSFIENIHQDNFDLLSANKQKVTKIGNETRKAISSSSEFNDLLTKMLNLRIQRSTSENATSSRSHLLISFEYDKHAKLAFIDLAG